MRRSLVLRIDEETLDRIDEYAERVHGTASRNRTQTLVRLIRRGLDEADRKAGIVRGEAGRGGVKRES